MAGNRQIPRLARRRLEDACRLPLSGGNYDLEFTLDGRLDDLSIDFEAMAAHLVALVDASAANGIGVRRVIFDPKMRGELRATSSWSSIEDLTFTTRRSRVRHDDHYHVDFDVPCEPL